MSISKELQYLLAEKYKGVKSPTFYFDRLLLYLGYPLAYIIGTQPFLKLDLKLRHRVLIPRPETEFWLKEYVFSLFEKDTKFEALDIFSGSGCLGLALAKEFKNAKVFLSDKNPKFIELIKENVHINNIKNAEAVQSDMFENLTDKKFDLILANPPYIYFFKFNFDLSILFEDWRSLFARHSGLYFIEELLNKAHNFMKKEAYLFLEFDPWQKKSIEKYLITSNLPYNFEFLKDQHDNTRILKLWLN